LTAPLTCLHTNQHSSWRKRKRRLSSRPRRLLGKMSNDCGSVQRGSDPWKNLRIGAIFVILVTSLCGTLSPIIAKRSWQVPVPVFDFVKYFGSGVIVSVSSFAAHSFDATACWLIPVLPPFPSICRLQRDLYTFYHLRLRSWDPRASVGPGNRIHGQLVLL
jgi:hypothetical protein